MRFHIAKVSIGFLLIGTQSNLFRSSTASSEWSAPRESLLLVVRLELRPEVDGSAVWRSHASPSPSQRKIEDRTREVVKV